MNGGDGNDEKLTRVECKKRGGTCIEGLECI